MEWPAECIKVVKIHLFELEFSHCFALGRLRESRRGGVGGGGALSSPCSSSPLAASAGGAQAPASFVSTSSINCSKRRPVTVSLGQLMRAGLTSEEEAVVAAASPEDEALAEAARLALRRPSEMLTEEVARELAVAARGSASLYTSQKANSGSAMSMAGCAHPYRANPRSSAASCTGPGTHHRGNPAVLRVSLRRPREMSSEADVQSQ